MKKRLLSLAFVLFLMLQLLPAASAASTITFRLIGADKEGNYETWVATTEYPVTKLTKVSTILQQVSEDYGLNMVGINSDYISSITAPEELGSYTMSEFTNGPYSGWMYTIDGSHPNVGICNKYLQDGNELIFHYVNDYRYEVEDWRGGTMGTEEDWNGWLEVADRLPSQKEDEPQTDPEEPKDEPAQEPEEEEKEELPSSVQELIEDIENFSVTKANAKTRNQLEALEEACAELFGEQITNLAYLQQQREVFDDLLDEAIEEAEDELDDYADSLDEKDFTDEQWEEVEDLLDDAQDDLNDAEDTDEIDDILSDVKKKIRAMTAQEEKEEITLTMNFTDVAQTDWFYEDVRYAVGSGLFNGTSDREFSPQISMTRAMVVTVLYRMAGSPTVSAVSQFTDVQADQWYTDAVLWASENRIVTGYSQWQFGTQDPVTRQQLAAILYRYATWCGEDVSVYRDLSAFVDHSSIAPYALTAMQWANAQGLINGRTADTLAPDGTASRCEVAAILHRFSQAF